MQRRFQDPSRARQLHPYIHPFREQAGTFSNAVGSQTPLLASLPRTTTLAPLPPIAPGKPRVVALAGDSMMAVGLSATLLRQAAGNKDLRMLSRPSAPEPAWRVLRFSTGWTSTPR
jgi:hypothetical protein